MPVVDGEGGYAGTDWMSKDVRFMWSTIADHDTDAHFDVVQGWSRTAELTLAHLGQVRKYRDNLASVWPPAKSPAAAAYLARLDKLLADLQATHDAAAANYTAFSTVTLTLSRARTKLKPIVEQYEANEKLNLEWQAKQDAAAKSGDPVLIPTLSIPPVSTSRQQQLNNQARVIMYDLSNTVISAHAALQKPKPYDPTEDFIKDRQGDGSSTNAGSGFAVPPVIPPPGAGSGNSGSPHDPISPSTAQPTHSMTTIPANPGQTSPDIGGGPILGGADPNPVITPPTPGQQPIPGTGPVPPPAPVGPISSVITPTGSSGLLPSRSPAPNTGRVPQGNLVKPGSGMGSVGRMIMPSGGVIGATPGSGMIGQMLGGVPGMQSGGSTRVNPVGGVIGQQSNRLTERGGDGSTESTRWDPDNPWATEEGVDPVVVPPEDPGPIDPGPAIGYLR